MDDDSMERLEIPAELEFGDETGDRRENDPRAPGYTPEDDRLFRSHFQRANRLADRAFEQVRPAYALGHDAGRDPAHAGRSFDELEPALESGWVNVPTALGDWAAVRVFAREGFERGRALGFIDRESERIGTTPTHDRPSYADPVPDNMDPTAPESPEQTLQWEHAGADAASETRADLSIPAGKEEHHYRRGDTADERPTIREGSEPGPSADQGGFGYRSPPGSQQDSREG